MRERRDGGFVWSDAGCGTRRGGHHHCGTFVDEIISGITGDARDGIGHCRPCLELGRNRESFRLMPMKFQYDMVRINMRDPQKTKSDLNELGEQGWELVAIFPYDANEGIAFLKRIKES